MAKKDIENCPYVKDMCGIPICRLNVLPCEAVEDKLCDCITEEMEKEDAKTESIHDCDK